MFRMKFLLTMVFFGFIIALGGLLFGVLTVGVPYQDPSPIQAAEERANLAISSWAMVGGTIFLSLGVSGIAILGICRLLLSRRQ